MSYETYATRAEADRAVAAYRAAGKSAYALTLRSDTHQVRVW